MKYNGGEFFYKCRGMFDIYRQRLFMFNACCQSNKTKRDNDFNVLIANFTIEMTKIGWSNFATKQLKTITLNNL